MMDRELWSEIWQVLKSNRLRTLLTASGIFWGVFILVVMLGFGNGIESGVNKSMSGYATNSLYLWGQATSKPYQGLPPGRKITLNNEDTQALRARVPGISTLAPRVRLARFRGRSDVVSDNKVTDAEISGDIPAYRNVLPMTLKFGRFINQFDLEEKRKVAVIGERIHRDLYGEEVNPIGRQIQIRQISFTVVGVFKPKRYGSNRERMGSLVMTPLSTFQQVFNYGDEIGFYAMIPEPGLRSEAVGAAMRQVLTQRHRVEPADYRAFGDWNSETEFLRIERLFVGIRAFIWTVGLATLLAGVLGVSNIMMIAIRERRREFGIRKSLGATPRAVLSMILAETMALVGVSGLLGLFAGLLALFIADLLTRPITRSVDADVLFDTPTIDLKIALAAIVALGIASLLAALIPARHAMKIDPVEALRAE